MAVKIAHAVANEFGTIKGGKVGDQGNEVRFGKWYARNKKGAAWTCRIRPRDPSMAERAAQMAETVVLNQGIGYGQEGELRNTIYDEAIKAGGDLSQITATCDCSSMLLTIFALLIPGFPHIGNTSSMAAQFARFPKYFEISRNEQDLDTDLYAKRGDMFLRVGHVLIVLSNGAQSGVSVAPTAPAYAQPEPEPEVHEDTPITHIIMDGIKKWCNVRSGPGTEYDKIGIAKVNEIFDVYETLDEWYRIDFHGKPGWVFYEFASEMLEGNV